MFPFENHFLETGAGTEVHYVDEDQGMVVLMLHGNPAWSLIMQMRAHFRCIAPDYPGFRLSTVLKRYDFLPSTHSEVLADVVE